MRMSYYRIKKEGERAVRKMGKEYIKKSVRYRKW
jgi:predicted transcriptional regulator